MEKFFKNLQCNWERHRARTVPITGKSLRSVVSCVERALVLRDARWRRGAGEPAPRALGFLGGVPPGARLIRGDRVCVTRLGEDSLRSGRPGPAARGLVPREA